MSKKLFFKNNIFSLLFYFTRSSKCWSWIGNEADEWNAINAIFYRHDLLSLISTDTFWFNEHPTKLGPAWGAKHSCACTWAHLEYIKTKQPFIIYNVHLEYPSINARHHSIPVLLSEINKNHNPNQVIITGDFNNWPEEIEGTTPIEELIYLGQKASEIQQMKKANFIDTYQHGEKPTFNGYRSAGYGPKIDFVWITSNSIYRIQGETKIDDYHDENGFFPSDHFPVYADLISTL
jgi:endonuclease/exonuclease/phosphatase family metal-dependent hydrolase